MGQLADLPNIGKVLEQQLEEVGIHTEEDLKRIGAEQIWLRIQRIDESACIHRLLALEGAIQGVKKNFLPEIRKAELKEFYQNFCNLGKGLPVLCGELDKFLGACINI